jgi:crossover junction endodeoxyribonuclease RusA
MTEASPYLKIVLPWPPSVLSPNAREHWRKIAQAKRNFRSDCFFLCVAAGIKKGAITAPVNLQFHFVPLNRRMYDLDNLMASYKAGIDGIADALGIDDRHFSYLPPTLDDEFGGRVEVGIFDKGGAK